MIYRKCSYPESCRNWPSLTVSTLVVGSAVSQSRVVTRPSLTVSTLVVGSAVSQSRVVTRPSLTVSTLVVGSAVSQSRVVTRPSFTSEWRIITSQDANKSELIFHHELGEVPVKVTTEIKVTIDLTEYIFNGYGSAHNDDDRSDKYGGVVYFYDDTIVKVMTPNANNQHTSGYAFYTGDATTWTGLNAVALVNVFVRVKAWKREEFPPPVYESLWLPLDTNNVSQIFQEVPHGLGEYPDFTVVQVRGLHNYTTEAQGMSNVVKKSNVRSTFGVLYSYSDHAFRIWTPGPVGGIPKKTQDCGNPATYDIIFVIDESGSVTRINFDKTKEAVKEAIKFLDINSGLVRVGILCYSTGSRVIFGLDSYIKNEKSALDAVDAIVYSKGSTYIASAMKKVRETMFLSHKGDRPDTENIMIVMTDGISYDPYSEFDEAKACVDAGIKIVTVGIGNNLNETMLKGIAHSEDLYIHTDFDSLGKDFENLMEAFGPCPSGGVIGADDGWGTDTGFASTTGEFKIMAWSFSEHSKLYRRSLSWNSLKALPSTIDFGMSLNKTDILLVAEVQPTDHANTGYKFPGIGSVMHDGTNGEPYGGFVYGYNSEGVVFWTPKPGNPSDSTILNIGDAWGNGEKSQSSDDVYIRITVWAVSPLEPDCSTTLMLIDASSNLSHACLPHNVTVKGNLNETCSSDRLEDATCTACFIPCPSISSRGLSGQSFSKIHHKGTVLYKRGLISVQNQGDSSTIIGACFIALPLTLMIVLIISDISRLRLDAQFGVCNPRSLGGPTYSRTK